MISLPIDQHIQSIREALHNHGAVVVTAAPGSGKSTRIPPALIADSDGEVIVLQPRRLPARALAARVAEERDWTLGRDVGYAVRFDRQGTAETPLWYLTEGILTRRLLRDPYLDGVATVVLDEFHERHLDTDLALSWLAELRRTLRPDLRLVVLSATLAAAPLARFLDDAPIIDAPVPTYPLQTAYRPPRQVLRNQNQRFQHMRQVVLEAVQQHPNDSILLFLSTIAQVRRAARELDDIRPTSCLFGGLSLQEQQAVLSDVGQPRIICSTNIAETSLTVPGIRVVIDSGEAMVARFDPNAGIDRLLPEKISQFSATQRAGRAHREGPGQVYRLWSAADDERRNEALTPEVDRCSLSPILLAVISLHGSHWSSFPWFEAPSHQRLQQAVDELLECKFIDENGITSLGRRAMTISLPPRLAALVLMASMENPAQVVQAVALAAILLEGGIAARSEGKNTSNARGSDDGVSSGVGGGLSSDLQRHVRWLAAETAPHATDAAAWRRARDTFFQVCRQIDVDPHYRSLTADGAVPLGRWLWRIWPERLAKRRGDPNRLALAGTGKQLVDPAIAHLTESSCAAVAKGRRPESDFVVVGALQQRRGPGGVQLFADLVEELDPIDTLAELGRELHTEEVVVHDRRRGAITCSKRTRFRAVTVDYREGVTVSDAVIVGALFRSAAGLPSGGAIDSLANELTTEERDAALQTLTAWLIKTESVNVLLGRWRWLQRLLPETPSLLTWHHVCSAFAAAALRGLGHGKVARRLADVDIHADDFLQLVPWELQEQLRQLLPTTLSLPGRRNGAVILYDDDDAIYVRSKLQDFFGLHSHPAVANGRQLLRLHLLAPNGREVQITEDLPAFWRGSYALVRKDLRGRYPKHAWPEDPLA